MALDRRHLAGSSSNAMLILTIVFSLLSCVELMIESYLVLAREIGKTSKCRSRTKADKQNRKARAQPKSATARLSASAAFGDPERFQNCCNVRAQARSVTSSSDSGNSHLAPGTSSSSTHALAITSLISSRIDVSSGDLRISSVVCRLLVGS